MPKGRLPTRTKCSVRGCARKHYGCGFCRPHFQRWRRNGTAGHVRIQTRTPTGAPCLVEGCERVGYTRGWCNAHYLRWRASGDPGAATVRNKRPQGTGGRWKDRHGYIILSIDGRRISEHRHVMEQKLRRALLPGESVHHINGRRDDNRPANLELWVSTHPSGQRVADVLRWALEVVHRYGGSRQ